MACFPSSSIFRDTAERWQTAIWRLPRVAAPYPELSTHDFVTFRGVNDAPIAMTAHVVYEAIDPETARDHEFAGGPNDDPAGDRISTDC